MVAADPAHLDESQAALDHLPGGRRVVRRTASGLGALGERTGALFEPCGGNGFFLLQITLRDLDVAVIGQ